MVLLCASYLINSVRPTFVDSLFADPYESSTLLMHFTAQRSYRSFLRSLSTAETLVFSMTPKSGIVIGLIILWIRLAAWFRAELHFRWHVGWVGVSNTLKSGTMANDRYIRMSLGTSIPASNRSSSSFLPCDRQSHSYFRSSIDSDDIR